MNNAKVAFLGLGAIGRPMAARIAGAGFPLTVWNRTAERAATFASDTGAKHAATPADAVREADVVVTCLSTSPDVHSLLEGNEGIL
ncbi:MAG TPA: NAD(P)-binding domain-containing protein, partial [Gemmatimonadaceae bacterium]|nr:NAD(P)-binding domain-containing protein [Gemmatimonadaceae bacterium]